MDPDALQKEVETWVRDGIITESQADAILERYETAGDGGRSRVVLALSAVGAVLVFAGVTLFLATNWEELPTAAQLAVLIGGPVLAYAGGAVAYRRSVPRIGLACSLLGAVLVGPSLFLLADLASIEVAETWLLFGWSAIALSTGHALDSRAGIGIGLALVAGLVVDLAEPADPAPPLSFFGIAVFALASLQTDRGARIYRIGGATMTLAGLLFLTTLDGRYGRFTVEPIAVLVATALAALAGAAWFLWHEDRHDLGWATVAIVAVGLATGLAASAPERLPETAAFLGIHLATVAVVGATGYVGYRSGSRRIIDLAVIAALAQTLSFVASTVVDALSGSLALVVAGVLLLAAGVVLERGRRTLLTRLER